jgi:hypothetical protein
VRHRTTRLRENLPLWYPANRSQMSRSDLERLVADAETSHELQQALRQSRSRQQLLHTARRLGYRVTRADLQNAWLEHHNAPAVNGAGGADRWAAGGS